MKKILLILVLLFVGFSAWAIDVSVTPLIPSENMTSVNWYDDIRVAVFFDDVISYCDITITLVAYGKTIEVEPKISNLYGDRKSFLYEIPFTIEELDMVEFVSVEIDNVRFFSYEYETIHTVLNEKLVIDSFSSEQISP